ncbi:MAG: hypothetical protein L0J65_01055 [Alkalibacterium sp.]|nr:hypothetical protein [Alkalibacterium sp.]MDN6626013.1 hypothetical protein [Pisciglobus halotolerans]MDN6671171.1 hypothetical protein [Staphylococcus equorum]
MKLWVDIRMMSVDLFSVEKVYDYLPGEDIEYPFVFIGEQFKQNERFHKDYLNGRTQVTIHFWHDSHKKRGSLASMMYELEKTLQQQYKSKLLEVNTQMLPDNSTGKELIHGIVEANIQF